jgi:filamentous hemagglutinin family protein
VHIRKTIVGLIVIMIAAQPSTAQIASDGSLPQHTQVIGCPTNCLITGGTAAGNNLFHSFTQFSVPTVGSAIFQPSSQIDRIFSRVTGGMPSQIDGSIGVDGCADLFLINPAGIQFGPNARLNLGGSFIGSTASTIDFGNGQKFGLGSNLLSINTPIGLDILRASGGISVVGNAIPLNTLGDRRFTPDGLAVSPGKTLALVGNGIDMNQAAIVAPSGNVELHSVGFGAVKVSINPLGYRLQPLTQARAAVNIRNFSRVDASGLAGSQINLSGDQMSLKHGSMLLTQNVGEPTVTRPSAAKEDNPLVGLQPMPVKSKFWIV